MTIRTEFNFKETNGVGFLKNSFPTEKFSTWDFGTQD
jgi:hypothetical protein